MTNPTYPCWCREHIGNTEVWRTTFLGFGPVKIYLKWHFIDNVTHYHATLLTTSRYIHRQDLTARKEDALDHVIDYKENLVRYLAAHIL